MANVLMEKRELMSSLELILPELENIRDAVEAQEDLESRARSKKDFLTGDWNQYFLDSLSAVQSCASYYSRREIR